MVLDGAEIEPPTMPAPPWPEGGRPRIRIVPDRNLPGTLLIEVIVGDARRTGASEGLDREERAGVK